MNKQKKKLREILIMKKNFKKILPKISGKRALTIQFLIENINLELKNYTKQEIENIEREEQEKISY